MQVYVAWAFTNKLKFSRSHRFWPCGFPNNVDTSKSWMKCTFTGEECEPVTMVRMRKCSLICISCPKVIVAFQILPSLKLLYNLLIAELDIVTESSVKPSCFAELLGQLIKNKQQYQVSPPLSQLTEEALLLSYFLVKRISLCNRLDAILFFYLSS